MKNNMGGLNMSPESLKLRCPDCFKLYSVRESDIYEQRPRFQCHSCDSRFWISFPEALEAGEVIGFPISWLEEAKPQGVEEESRAALEAEVSSPSTQTQPVKERSVSLQVKNSFHCPKCEATYASGDQECASCGVVFAKFDILQNQQQESRLASKELKALWERAVENYDNRQRHSDFLRACQAEQNLVYAAAQYGRILQAQSQDEIAQEMSQAVVALSSVQIPLAKSSKEGLGGSGRFERTQKKRPNIAWPRVSSLVIFMSTVIIVFGYFVPTFRNMVGVGAALIFLSVALRMYFPRV